MSVPPTGGLSSATLSPGQGGRWPGTRRLRPPLPCPLLTAPPALQIWTRRFTRQRIVAPRSQGLYQAGARAQPSWAPCGFCAEQAHSYYCNSGALVRRMGGQCRGQADSRVWRSVAKKASCVLWASFLGFTDGGLSGQDGPGAPVTTPAIRCPSSCQRPQGRGVSRRLDIRPVTSGIALPCGGTCGLGAARA